MVSDDHRGLAQAVQTHVQGASWQRCQTPFIDFSANILDACPTAWQGELHGRLRLLFDAPDLEMARRLQAKVVQQDADRARKAVEGLAEGCENAMAVMARPERDRKRLRTTPSLGRLNEEIRRRAGAIRSCRTRRWRSS